MGSAVDELSLDTAADSTADEVGLKRLSDVVTVTSKVASDSAGASRSFEIAKVNSGWAATRLTISIEVAGSEPTMGRIVASMDRSSKT